MATPAAALSRVMGGPTIAESGGIQYFEGGFIQRVNSASQAVRVEAWSCPSVGPCALIGVERWSALGTFCPSVNGDTKVNILDLSAIAAHEGDTTYPEYLDYDLNGDGVINILDLSAAASKYNTSCTVQDP
jgi:hypothetical protein